MRLKKSLAILMIMAAMLVLGACGDSATSTPGSSGSTATTAASGGSSALTTAPAASSGGQAVTITWFVRPDPAPEDWRQQAIKDFQAQNPNIKINMVTVTRDDYETKLQTLISAGNAPDIWSQWGSNGFADYVKRGLVADLNPYIQANNFDLSDFNQNVLNVYKQDGKLLGLPILTTGSFLYYNKDLFDQAGVPTPPTDWSKAWTWQEFTDTAAKLTKNTGDAAKSQWGTLLSTWPNDQYVWMFGQDTYPDEAYKSGLADKTNWNSPQAVKAFQAVQDATYVQKVAPDTAQAQGLTDGFLSGRAAMVVDGGWGLWIYNKAKFKWGIAPLPTGGTGAKPMLFTDPWLLSSRSKHPAEAAKFLLFLSSADRQKTLAQAANVPPVRTSLLKDWYTQNPTSMKPAEFQQVFEGALSTGRESPNHLIAGFNQIDRVVSAGVDTIRNNKGKPSDVLPGLSKDLDSTLQQIKSDVKS